MAKYIKRILMVIIGAVALLPCKMVFATGSLTVSTGSVSIVKGQSTTVTVNANSAAGRVVFASGNSGIATVSSPEGSSAWLDNSPITLTIVGVSAGNTQITVTATDMTTYDDLSLDGTVKTISVAVTEPAPAPAPAPAPTPSTPSGGSSSSGGSSRSSGSSGSSGSTTTEPEPVKSTNAEIKTVKVGKFEVKKSNDKYTVTVDSDTEEIEIVVEPEDSKATVSGVSGKQKVKEGVNKYTVTVTAEDGTTKKSYAIEVTRPSKNCPVCGATTTAGTESDSSPFWMIIAIIEGLVILLGIAYFVFLMVSKKKDDGQDTGGKPDDDELNDAESGNNKPDTKNKGDDKKDGNWADKLSEEKPTMKENNPFISKTDAAVPVPVTPVAEATTNAEVTAAPEVKKTAEPEETPAEPAETKPKNKKVDVKTDEDEPADNKTMKERLAEKEYSIKVNKPKDAKPNSYLAVRGYKK